ncbi:MAG: UDP-N-acetylmuramoyl-L-alanine--D-glutamate ligase [Clostridiales bacterium]|nr:UDP-N-acetylmuramoyl-L-alanine--D-glutamate ligase [Clostridiales bacterium]
MKNYFKNKLVLVYGLSLSGEWATKLLLRLKAKVFLYDDDRKKLNGKFKNCFVVTELNESLIAKFDYLIVSPSIEKDNEFLTLARNNYVKIMSELEFASAFCKDLVAVTGTNGKTTTVEMISSVLNQKRKSVPCGNIGYPVSRAVLEKKKHLKVVEVSSFMMENSKTFAPHVATILNIQPDHLIRHKTMEIYTNEKMKILDNIKPSDYVVINLDAKIKPKTNGKTITYSYSHNADIFLKNGYICYKDKKVLAVNELKVKGKHNILNLMCAIAYGIIYKVSLKKIKEALINFKLEKYRVEYVSKVNKITFINDSKSTNIASTLACVESVKSSIVLLLGGSKKGLDYKELFLKLPKKVRLIVAFGEIKEDLINANQEKFKMLEAENLKEAFNLAVNQANQSDSVVLSPASASYDEFSSYIERGMKFNDLVKEYENSKK